MKSYALSYIQVDDPNSGFEFACDSGGNLLNAANSKTLTNYERCQNNPKIKFEGFITYKWNPENPNDIFDCLVDIKIPDSHTMGE